MKTRTRLSLLATTAAVVATPLLITTAARAAIWDPVETRSVTLRFNPRDLSSDRGADHLLGRISIAAGKVCDTGGSMVQLMESGSYRTCRHDAIAHAVVDVNRPTVTAAYTRHFGERDGGLRAALDAPPAIGLRMVAVD